MIAHITWVPTDALPKNVLPRVYKPSYDEVVSTLAVTRPELEEALEEGHELPTNDIGGLVLDTKTIQQANFDDEEELEDFKLIEGDNMLICSRSSDESFTDFCVYNSVNDDFFVHHSNMLSSMPLCTAFFDFMPGSATGERGAYVACATCEPGIEIWDLALMDATEPICVLGGKVARQLPNTKKIGGSKIRAVAVPKVIARQRKAEAQFVFAPGSHKQAVLSLSWSPLHRNLLCSCGDDGTIKLWDLSNKNCIGTFQNIHHGIISYVQFHPTRPGVVMSLGMTDRTLKITDLRTAVQNNATPAPQTLLKLPGTADAENACFMGMNGEYAIVTNQIGELFIIDTAKSILVTSIANVFGVGQGQNCPITGIAPHPLLEGLIAVSSPESPDVVFLHFTPATNSLVELFRIPSNIGNVFALSWCTESCSLAASSAAAKVAVWQVLRGHEELIRATYPAQCNGVVFPPNKNHVIQLSEGFNNEEEQFDEGETRDEEVRLQ